MTVGVGPPTRASAPPSESVLLPVKLLPWIDADPAAATAPPASVAVLEEKLEPLIDRGPAQPIAPPPPALATFLVKVDPSTLTVPVAHPSAPPMLPWLPLNVDF